MDIGIFRGLVTAVLFFAFCGVVVWAWSGKRRSDFAEAARLPLQDASQSSKIDSEENNNG